MIGLIRSFSDAIQMLIEVIHAYSYLSILGWFYTLWYLSLKYTSYNSSPWEYDIVLYLIPNIMKNTIYLVFYAINGFTILE